MKNTDITKENIDIAMLLDFYGQLLTQKALLVMELYYNEDMSLSEISEITKITRQAVHDSVRRSVISLKNYEEKLVLVKRFKQQQEIIALAISEIENEHFESAKDKLIKLTTTL